MRIVVLASVAILWFVGVNYSLKQDGLPVAGDKRGNRCYNGIFWEYYNALKSSPVTVTVAAEKPKWQYKLCYTNSCIADMLNSLSDESASEAKLTTWDDKTYVWYR